MLSAEAVVCRRSSKWLFLKISSYLLEFSCDNSEDFKISFFYGTPLVAALVTYSCSEGGCSCNL